MAKVFCNSRLDLSKEGQVWSASNGATRRTLVVINKINGSDQAVCFNAQVGFLDKGNHSFIFINPAREGDNRVFGLFLNSDYAYQVLEGKEVFTNYSQGGYGNSCSQFGIYEVGALLEVNTYKNRQTPSYYRLTVNGWINIKPYEVEQGKDIQEV